MTDHQPTLFDPAASREAREEAMRQVFDNADEEFRFRAFDSVVTLARLRDEFTTDDVIDYMDRTHPGVWTHEPRAWGPVMRAAARAGWILNTGRVRQSNMVTNHRRPKTIWRSVLRIP